jgi:hypothetical protein
VLAALPATLDAQAAQLADEATALRYRAAIVDVASAFRVALSDPKLRGLGGKELLDRLADDEALKAALGTLNLVGGPDELWSANRRWTRLLQYREAQGLWNELVNPALLRHGQDSYQALKGYFRFEEFVSHMMPLAVAHEATRLRPGTAAALRASEAAAAVGPGMSRLRVAGKLAAPLDIALSAHTAINGSQYEGVRGGVDRGVAGASAVASAVVVAGMVAPVPVAGQVAAGVILTAAGVWVVGNMVYDHRKEIARAAVSAAEFVDRNKVAIAAHAGGPVTALAYQHRDDLRWAGEKALDAGGWAVRHADDMPRTISKLAPWNW